MKNLIIAVLLCTASLSYAPLLAQMSVDPPVYGFFTNDSINFNSTAFRNNATNRFFLAWNWGENEGWLDSALGINAYHSHALWFNYQSQTRPWDADLVLNLYQWGDYGYAGIGPFNSQSMWYHPELTVDSTSAFQPMPNDPQGAVFGWVGKAVGQRGTGIEQWRWLLAANGVNWRQPVLWNIWKGTGFAWQHWNVKYKNNQPVILEGGMNDSVDVAPLGRDDTLYQPRNGKRWYLTISLKATDANQFNALPDTARLLSITIPYNLYNRITNTNSTGSIRFDSLPNPTGAALYAIQAPRNTNDIRGIGRAQLQDPSKPNEFIITKAMLAGQDNTTGITLSTFFRTDGVPDVNGYRDNPILQPESNYTGSPTTIPDEYITQLGINVFYYPNADVAIDYVRLGTQQAQRVYMGAQDIELRAATRQAIAQVEAAQNPPFHAPKIFRFYNVEERREQWWGMMRYYNALLDWRCTAEINSKHNPPAQYFHATHFNEYWQGDAYQTSIDIASPFLRQAKVGNDSTFGYQMGYEGHVDEVYSRAQVERSHYENALPTYQPKGTNSWLSLPSNPFAGDNTAWFSPDSNVSSHAHLFTLEKLLHNSYYEHREMLYGALPWWSNVWMASQYWYHSHKNNAPFSVSIGFPGCDRPCTGEEARLEMSIPLLLGAKGFAYWRGSPVGSDSMFSDLNKFVPGLAESDSEAWIQRLPLQHNSPAEALLSPLSGSDWMPTTDTVYAPWGKWFRADRHLWNLMSIDSNHIYLGKRTGRAEIYRITSLIHAHEAEILALQLQAWYAKGWIRMYSQHPSHTPASDTLLHHFVQSSQLRSRPLGRVHGGSNTPWYENEVAGQDSTYADITLLNNTTIAAGMDSVFYLGVQNRRTDPLWHDSSYANDEMIFVPTAEWDELMHGHNGRAYWKAAGDQRDTMFWQQKFWARQGCREIVLPFNYTHPDGQPRLLHVQQMGGGVNGLDTIVRQNAPLALRFEPGEGKLLRITVQPARASIAQGNLNNSNQRKMVCYPIMRQMGAALVPTDSLRYHLAYYRQDSSGRINVYYRRSIPYSQKQTHTPGIEWEGEVNLTQFGFQKLDGRFLSSSCAVPSIVVRMDTVDLDNSTIPPTPQIKVYVVYACADDNDPTMFRVVESVFNAQHIAPSYYPPLEIDSATGIRYKLGPPLSDEEFLCSSGAPAVSAAAGGNYYAWADSLLGIISRWKPAQSTSFAQGGTPRHNFRYLSGMSVCSHPCIISYSRIGLGERDVSLVWNEDNVPTAPAYYLPYSRLRTTGNPLAVQHYLPPNLDTNSIFRCVVKADSSIAVMNTNNLVYPEFPVIYAGVEEYTPTIPRPLTVAHWERVAWSCFPGEIHTRGVDIADSIPGNSPHWGAWFENRVWSSGNLRLWDPQLAQGVARRGSDGFTNLSDSAVVMNFTTVSQLTGLASVWQLQYGYWSFLPLNPDIERSTTDPAYLPQVGRVNDGAYARLSAQPSIMDGSYWQNNRRVYNAAQQNLTMYSSAENFYKQQAEEQDRPLHYAGFVLPRDSGRAFKTLISQANVGANELLFRTEKKMVNGRMHIKTDTIYSDWFRAGNTTKLRAFTLGMNNPCVRVQVERRKENGNDRGERFELPYLAAGNDTAKRRNSFTLLRGGNKLYRLALINTCSNGTNSPRYTEEIQLDGLSAADREADLAKSGVEEDITIDLGDIVQGSDVLSVQPNPANEKVTLRFDGLPDDYEDTHYNYELGIYTQLGQRVYSGSIRAGESQTLSTASFVPGVYSIQLKGSRGLVSLPLVIMR